MTSRDYGHVTETQQPFPLSDADARAGHHLLFDAAEDPVDDTRLVQTEDRREIRVGRTPLGIELGGARREGWCRRKNPMAVQGERKFYLEYFGGRLKIVLPVVGSCPLA